METQQGGVRMIIQNQVNPPLLETLAHYGVKGMQWGVRRQKSRGELRALNRQSRKNDRASAKAAVVKARTDRDKEIDAARTRVNSGQTRQDLKAAKAQYKSDKGVIGKREAKKKLVDARIKAHTDMDTARQVKSGAETAAAVIGLVGGTAVAALATANRNANMRSASGFQPRSSPNLPPRRLVYDPATGSYH
jgi:hypothetical protein